MVAVDKEKALLWREMKRRQQRRQAAAWTATKGARRRRKLLLAAAAVVVREMDGKDEKRKAPRVRRLIKRTEGGWEKSTMAGYVFHGDEQTYKKNFRMTQLTFNQIARQIEAANTAFVSRAGCVPRKKHKLVPTTFKLGTCLYILALGVAVKAGGDCASVGESTVRAWLSKFALTSMTVLKPIYMPGKPMESELLNQVREEFAARRGVTNVALACDGTHVPFSTHNAEYRNYKGWYSTLAVAFVNSFYLFVDADVGYPGRAGDNTVLPYSHLMREILNDPDLWLGPNGVILGDSGASDGDSRFMNPFPHPKTPEEFYFNFCHSSTRFFVEEVFGRWKNRFRFLLREHDMKHKLHSQLVYTTMILHNICTIMKDDAVEFECGACEEWQRFFTTYKRHACPTCTRFNIAHCTHTTRNRNREKQGRSSHPVTGTPAEQRATLMADLWASLREGEHDLNACSDRERAQLKRMHKAMQERAGAGTYDRI